MIEAGYRSCAISFTKDFILVIAFMEDLVLPQSTEPNHVIPPSFFFLTEVTLV